MDRATENRKDMPFRSPTLPPVKQGHLRSQAAVLLLCGVLLSLLTTRCSLVLSQPSAHSARPAPTSQPYPTSSYVTAASIAPMVLSLGGRAAGDNWPSTWADDGRVYTYLADGTGFGLPSPRSMAPAYLEGNPAADTLVGHPIRTNALGQASGSGSSGRKVSGLISLPDPGSPTGHVLYAWVRNITPHGGASLLYSYDHAATWAWAWGDPNTTASAIIPELGHPTWMQAGQNNAAAQDGHLYFYSQDAPTAYQVTDTVLLGRVASSQVRVQRAYQYFAGLDGKGNARWTTAIAMKKPVFRAAGQCYRVFVTYAPGLQRYFLLTATGDRLDSSWRAGHPSHHLAIYEAPTPWGPWHTVLSIDSLHPYRDIFAPQIVPAWMAADGTSFYLLYSSDQGGPYRFNLQKVTLRVTPRFRNERAEAPGTYK